MTFKMKGSGFYGKGNQSPAKQKDRLDAMQQQTDINSADADLYHKERAVSMQKDEDRHTRQKNTRSKLAVFSPLKNSPAKQKDYLDAKQQQVASGRVDLEEKKEKAAIRKSERSHKYRSRIVGGPGAAII